VIPRQLGAQRGYALHHRAAASASASPSPGRPDAEQRHHASPVNWLVMLPAPVIAVPTASK
jgi:hypothetical protein